MISSTSIYNGCKPVLHTQNTQVKLDEPSICRYGLGTLETERSSVVELSQQMSSCKDLVVDPSQLGSLKGLIGTKDTRGFILVRPLTIKVKAYV